MTRVWIITLFAFAVAFVALFASLSDGGSTAVAGDDEPGYIGPKGCKKCHFKQHKDWKKSELAKAFDRLKPGQCEEAKKAAGLDPAKDYTKDPKCLKCHTTGYGTATGYPAVVEGKAWTEEETARAETFAGVTCEACHGPGSKYSVFKKENKEFKRAQIAELGAYSPVTAENCTPCHNEENPTAKKGEVWDFEKHKASDAMHKHQELKYEH